MQTIIITGTSKGLGLVLAQRLYNRLDCQIATISRREKFYEDFRSLNYQGDITNSVDGIQFINYTLKKFGQINVLINNAGIVNLKPFLEYNPSEFNELFAVNTAAPFFLSQLCIQQMLTQKEGGHIINIGSTRSITGAPDKSVYSMSKFALRSMTQCINAEFKNRNIMSTIICPGKLDDLLTEDVVDTIEYLINNKIRIIPEIIIGGQL